MKSADVFFLSERDGQVPVDVPHGCGLYYHDCRFLDGYVLELAGTYPTTLVATAPSGSKEELVLTNLDLSLGDGKLVPKEDVGIEWERLLDASIPALRDRITIHNFGDQPIVLPLSFRFHAAFEDVFVVRGMPADKQGRLRRPVWRQDSLFLAYDGSDGVHRGVTIHFCPAPQRTKGTQADYDVQLEPHAQQIIHLTAVLAESAHALRASVPPASPADFQQTAGALGKAARDWAERHTEVQSDSRLLREVLGRSLCDLHMLRSELKGRAFFAAGVPWYVALFGRDSLIAVLESLAYNADVAEETLRLLADYQGNKVDAWRDEEPGKIMHELRVGELAHTNQVPQTPYYGSVDATPLFLILLSRHAAWTGSLDLFRALRGSVEAALSWLTMHDDPEGRGYLAYQVKSRRGLGNQGWKDSGDAIMNADGSLACPPIALAEVQGYVYLAKMGLADLYRRAGDPQRGDQLEREAKELRHRFNRDFWLDEQGIFALALQAGGKPAAVVASNAGQVLWSGIADSDKARRTAERLMREDMFSGWGIRTLSSQEKRYNPIGYHIGTVWPHDNALIAAGFRVYGLDEFARQLFAGIFGAATQFPTYRLPEVFAGFPRKRYGVPVPYPVACHPQAWAAGALPFMMVNLLGLVPEAFDGQLRIVRPMLPHGVNWIELRRLHIGRAHADLRFERSSNDDVNVQVLGIEGDLKVVIDSGSTALVGPKANGNSAGLPS